MLLRKIIAIKREFYIINIGNRSAAQAKVSHPKKKSPPKLL
jgi:hypothetical protein